MACDDYRPDHNGECLNCDEWADEHAEVLRAEIAQAHAQLQWIGECLEGLDVSHFAESFPLVRAVAELRAEIERLGRVLRHEGIEHSECQDALIKAQAVNIALMAVVRKYLDNHCANADAEGVSALCECSVCLEARALLSWRA